MYEFINTFDDSVIGYSDTVNYIRLSKNGCYVPCPEADAQGVAYNSAPYHLFGRPDLDDLPTVLVNKVDTGHEVDALKAEDKSLGDQTTQLQLALVEVYEIAMTVSGLSEVETLSDAFSAVEYIYAELVRKNLKALESVPEKHRANVEAILNGESK